MLANPNSNIASARIGTGISSALPGAVISQVARRCKVTDLRAG